MAAPGTAAKPSNPDSITGGVRCRYLDQQAPEEFLGPRGCLRYHTVGAHTMCGYYYPAEGSPRGVVILVHGQVRGSQQQDCLGGAHAEPACRPVEVHAPDPAWRAACSACPPLQGSYFMFDYLKNRVRPTNTAFACMSRHESA